MEVKPELYFSNLTLTYQATDSLLIPPYCGSLWHSVFGRALREISCIEPQLECTDCALLYRCDYPYLFKRWANLDSQMMAGKEIPVPHIFRTDNETKLSVAAGQDFKLSLVVVGEAIAKLPSIIRAFRRVGINGLGKNRVATQLKSISINNAEQSDFQMSDLDIMQSVNQPAFPEIPNCPKTVLIQFRTPYKPSGKAAINQLDYSHFLMAIVRRISLLQYFYCGKPLIADFNQLKSFTEQVQITTQAVQWVNPPRPYFSKHGTRINNSGWVGDFELHAESIPALWPYLWLGQWLGVGKKTSMGFGRYVIMNPPN